MGRERYRVAATGPQWRFVRLDPIDKFGGTPTRFADKKQVLALLAAFLDGERGQIEADVTWPPPGMVETGVGSSPPPQPTGEDGNESDW
jgi:hypothetical protein